VTPKSRFSFWSPEIYTILLGDCRPDVMRPPSTRTRLRLTLPLNPKATRANRRPLVLQGPGNQMKCIPAEAQPMIFGPRKAPDPQPSNAGSATTGCLDHVGKACYQLMGQNLTGKQFITLMLKATSAVRQTSPPALHCRSGLLPTINW
jgi:hypothetical protein